jgi:hypothetical protein
MAPFRKMEQGRTGVIGQFSTACTMQEITGAKHEQIILNETRPH